MRIARCIADFCRTALTDVAPAGAWAARAAHAACADPCDAAPVDRAADGTRRGPDTPPDFANATIPAGHATVAAVAQLSRDNHVTLWDEIAPPAPMPVPVDTSQGEQTNVVGFMRG